LQTLVCYRLIDPGSIPTEEVLADMRASVPPIYYLVGTPKGRLSKLEADLLERPWKNVQNPIIKSCSNNSSSRCQPNRHRASAPHGTLLNQN
jgi:hypothetical protein